MKIIFKIAALFVGVLFFVNLSFASAGSNKIAISRISKNELIISNFYGGAGFMITSSIGTAIVTDPYDVDEDVNSDIVVVSHDHYDHNDDAFFKRMQNSRISLYKPESFIFKDIRVKSIGNRNKSYVGSLNLDC